MTDRRSFLTGLAAVPLAGALAGCAQSPSRAAATQQAATAVPKQPVEPFAATKLTDRVTVISGVPGNVTALAAGDGVLLVDSGSTTLAPSVRKALGSAHVRTLFNTHYHADQTGGNALFAKAGAEIHAQTITRQWLAAKYYVPAEDRWVPAPPKEAVPTMTFREQGTLTAGAEHVEFGYLLEAHTRGDAYVFFRDSNVLVAGDVSSPLRDPVLDWFAGGWLGGRADALDKLVKLANDGTRIVPAYGKVLSYAELQAERDMMAKLYDVTADLTAHGRSAKDMLDAGVLDNIGRKFQDPYQFLYDAAKGFQAHYTNFGGNVV